MDQLSTPNQIEFRRILARSVILPVIVGVVSAALFCIFVFYLLAAQKWVMHTVEVIGKSNEVLKLGVDMQTGMRGYLIAGEEKFLTPYRLAKPKFEAELVNLKAMVQDNQQQIERIERIQSMQAAWIAFAQSTMEMRRKGEDYQQFVRDRGGLEFDEIRNEFSDFQDVEKSLLRDRINTSTQVTWISVIVYLAVTLLLKGWLSWIGRRSLLRLSETYNNTLLELQSHSEKLENQAWQRAGQAQLAEKTIGQASLPLLGRSALDFIAYYLDAAVAAMYVREENGSRLKRIATYGVGKGGVEKESSEGSEVEQSFENTESLVGQSSTSNRLIHLKNLPDTYLTHKSSLKVNSGLGSTAPTNLVLLPIEHEGNVNGVLEIGFLKEPPESAFEFLKSISPNIGSSIEASLYRKRLQDALEETQQLNEELQAQQEELRSSNEELEEQSRALEESQVLLENQKAELEQTNDRLLDQAVALDQKNVALNAIQVELEERAQDLQRASRYKSEFLANMSHELRTPLNSSMILAKLLAENQKGNLNEEQIEFAKSIYSAGNDLLNLINDILDISKVEAGKLELAPEHIPLQRLIDALRLTFSPLAAQKHLQFKTRLEIDTPQTIFTDSQRLEQIIKNLLSNAIKFTETGEISLAVSRGSNDTIEFSVTDSGIGIELDQQEIIFEAFRQADGGISRRYGGTGLGLSISRDLTSLLGGSIAVSSTPGVGSTFTLTLPVNLVPASERSENSVPVIVAKAPSTKTNEHATESNQNEKVQVNAFPDDRENREAGSRSVLVIEDDAAFAKILYELAHELQYRCLVAQTAAEGLQIANDFLPDAILLDIGLPDTSGINVLQSLKANPRTRHIPVHIVSASDRTEAALQLGAIGYAIKPTTRERLQEVFQKLEGKFTQKIKHVLLVEDDALQRHAVTQLIGDDDVEITAVESGGEAIALLRNTIFDCMIIDLKLPDMQGHELLQRMSTENICCFPPVIVYTGRNLTRAEENDLLKYSRSIIIKGARSPERLLDEVTLFLHKVESELSSDRQSMLKTVRSRDRVLEGRRVLLVDDDVRNIFALTGALEQKGAVVEIARNGFEALSKLDEISDIDLVLMDIMMPGMDGLEATRIIRKDPRFQKLPIIAVTAKAMKDDQEQCISAGASDYLAKPIDIDRLYSLLRVWMSTMERI